ncbi:MAG: M48 family metallopeptidase [Clostridia bacterium]|nr:M48 family metallopeptidase [Clostridia bacterium]
MTEPYTVIRSSRRTLALEVRADGTLVVRAPRRMPEREIARFVEAKTAWIASARARQARRAEAQAAQPDTDPDTLRARAEAELPPRLAAWAARMGLEPASLRITSAEKRLGSCSADGHICLSYNLLRWPDAVVEYVIVHELAHMRHHDHSAAFYAEIERWLPDYRDALATLRGR